MTQPATQCKKANPELCSVHGRRATILTNNGRDTRARDDWDRIADPVTTTADLFEIAAKTRNPALNEAVTKELLRRIDEPATAEMLYVQRAEVLERLQFHAKAIFEQETFLGSVGMSTRVFINLIEAIIADKRFRAIPEHKQEFNFNNR